MKRSAVSIVFLAAAVLLGAVSEFAFSNYTAARIERTVELCRDAEDGERYALCVELKREFDGRKRWNGLFFSRKVTDELDDALGDLAVCAKYGDRVEFERVLERLSFRTGSIHNAGVF